MSILRPDKLHGQMGDEIFMFEDFLDVSSDLSTIFLYCSLQFICINAQKICISNYNPNPPPKLHYHFQL